MFPNAVMSEPKTWNDILGVDDRGARTRTAGTEVDECDMAKKL